MRRDGYCVSLIRLGSRVFSISLSSEMKEEEGIAGVTGWRSIIEAKVTVGLKMLPEVTVEDAVVVELDRGARPEDVSLRGTDLPLPLALETPAITSQTSAMVTC